MAFQSGGVVRKGVVWTGTPATWPGSTILSRSMSYAAMYEQNETVAAVVDKLARATARLPLKVYERAEGGRPEARDHPYAVLLRSPSSSIDPFTFWVWTVSTLNLYGEVFWGKIRDAGGRPIELVPLHPVAMNREEDGQWTFMSGRVRIEKIDRADLVHFRFFNPYDVYRGYSPLESLRQTLVNTDAARRAQAAFWNNAGRPSVALSHPGVLGEKAAQRLAMQWQQIHGGADNFGKVVVLEEGMKPEILSLSAEEAQYVEARKLDREEVLIRLDVPPPVLHVLDHATYSNITEQMRSMYRDTMAPRLRHLESVLEFDLRRDDFGDDVYAEFLLDEVLRGDFEQRVSSYQTLHAMGWPLNEIRELENRPPVEGGDVSMVNAALVPLGSVAAGVTSQPALPSSPVDEPPQVGRSLLAESELRTLMGRLSRPSSLADISAEQFVAGLNGSRTRVLAELHASKSVGESVAQFRARIKALGGTP